jgi:drug/metabolite transporter (DMT)-like permease
VFGGHRGALFALASALLFGGSTPLSKALVSDIHPVLLAGILYLSSGLGLLIVEIVNRFLRAVPRSGEPLGLTGSLWLAGAILSGGVVAPILLMIGLTLTPASTASLLLNLEGVLTALLAWFAFREIFVSRHALGMASIVCGAVVLSWQGQPTWTVPIGPALIVSACLAWAIDNNLTRKVAFGNPMTISIAKGLVAGSCNLFLAVSLGASEASSQAVAAASLVGFINYGVSNVLFVLALRQLGAARTAAYYATAPFFGTLIAIILLGESVTTTLAIATTLMGIGVFQLTKRVP